MTNPGVNALRTPIYAEMVNIIQGEEVTFNDYKFDLSLTRSQLENFTFSNGRPVTRSFLAWWAMQQDNQSLPDIDTVFEIEHIYARNRNEQEQTLSDSSKVEKIGNKSMLEKRINIRASDYRFCDKKKHYQGCENSKGEKKDGTIIVELLNLSSLSIDFSENDIDSRTNSIFDAFCKYLKNESLSK